MQFRNEYYFLSNMYPCTIVMDIDGKAYTFKSAEAAFQAHKCPERAKEFENINGYDAKKLGRKVKLRPDWDKIKDDIMSLVVNRKFTCNPQLQQKLINITNPIVEDNTWGDTYWGKVNGNGENKLGIILTAYRDAIMKER